MCSSRRVPRSVDLTTGVVTVRRAFSAGELQTPKSRRARQVPVVGGLGTILARMTSGRRPAELVLLGPLGGRLYHSNFRTKVQWPELVKGLGWPGLRFHDLRATAIVLWIRHLGPAAQVNSYISRTRGGV